MIISNKVEEELVPIGYIQPEIDLGEHEWEWTKELTLGISKQETKEFEHFLKNSIPVLGYLREEIKRITAVMQKNRSLSLRQLEEAYTPFIKLH
ncbi:MAG: hypothetical protein KGH76_06905, partial [Thaumarchaeota archaeon]|nr:hypothetical protein [Nitrososphaerota archaeon]